MLSINRREFCETVLVLTQARNLFGAANALDDNLRASLEKRKIPAVVAKVATAEETTYAGAFGTRDSTSGVKVTTDSIFAIASMTKAVTSVAAMQFVESGKVKLDEPVAKYLPQLSKLEILTGFDKATSKPVLRPATKPVTLKHLLTHTSGFAYPTWDSNMLRYTQQTGPIPAGTVPVAPTPLMFEPGARWQYGYSVDWAGRLVEALSGQPLEQYLQKNIFKRLGMKDTSNIFLSENLDRWLSWFQRK